MNGSTVGDSDTRGQFTGQCHSWGLYTAYGAQFVIGSCQTIPVVARTISRMGWRGYRRQKMTTAAISATIMMMVPS
jgi:hypothetical protein